MKGMTDPGSNEPVENKGRRQFLKGLGAIGATAAISGSFLPQTQPATAQATTTQSLSLARRPFGRHAVRMPGFRVRVIEASRTRSRLAR